MLLHRETPGRLEPYIAKASTKLFGITDNETLFDVPDAYWSCQEGSPEKEHLDDLYHEHEER